MSTHATHISPVGYSYLLWYATLGMLPFSQQSGLFLAVNQSGLILCGYLSSVKGRVGHLECIYSTYTVVLTEKHLNK